MLFRIYVVPLIDSIGFCLNKLNVQILLDEVLHIICAYKDDIAYNLYIQILAIYVIIYL